MGNGPYMRDELSIHSHLRGTVGISTRGRDTGDAHIFINLIDNMRLDHNYTIFAEIVAGMEVVDGILEGAVIVVQGDTFEVIGQSYVAIYDYNRMLDSGGKFYFLAPGDRFDLKTREASRPRTTREPLDRVTDQKWSN